MQIRDARFEDAAAVAGVNVRSWRAAYGELMPASFLAAMTVEDETARWERAIATSAQRARPVLVAEDADGGVVGYSVLGADVDDSSRGLLFLMYVDPDAWGTGAGWALMQESEARLRSAGFERAGLWVLEANTRARRFYERQGWAADGSRSSATYGDVRLFALRYEREL